MVRTTDRRPRPVARVAAWIIAPALLALGLASACQELAGSIGDDCLKDQDCQSGVCSELHCAPRPPLLDAAYVPPGDATLDAPAESGGANDGGDSASAVPEGGPASDDGAPDATESDTGAVQPGDAGEDVVDEGHADAETDGPIDAIADADRDGGG
jgi:hypothetical protein